MYARGLMVNFGHPDAGTDHAHRGHLLARFRASAPRGGDADGGRPRPSQSADVRARWVNLGVNEAAWAAAIEELRVLLRKEVSPLGIVHVGEPEGRSRVPEAERGEPRRTK